jgi:hypothetical protein
VSSITPKQASEGEVGFGCSHSVGWGVFRSGRSSQLARCVSPLCLLRLLIKPFLLYFCQPRTHLQVRGSPPSPPFVLAWGSHRMAQDYPLCKGMAIRCEVPVGSGSHSYCSCPVPWRGRPRFLSTFRVSLFGVCWGAWFQPFSHACRRGAPWL